MSTQRSESTADSAPQQSSLQTILIFVVVAVAVYAISRYLLAPTQGDRGEKHAAVGRRAPDVEFMPLTESQTLRLTGQKGKVVLINYWGEWCGPCRLEFPHLVKLTGPYLGRQDFVMASVNVPGGFGEREALAAEARKFLKAHAARFPAYLDDDNSAFEQLMSSAQETRGAIPLTMIIDKQGLIAGVWMGYIPGDEEDVARVLKTALEDDKKVQGVAD